MPGPSESRWWTTSARDFGKFGRDSTIASRGRCLRWWMKRLCCCTGSLRSSRRHRKMIWIWHANVNGYICKIMKKRIHRGAEFREFLKEEGILEEMEEQPLKQSVSMHFD